MAITSVREPRMCPRCQERPGYVDRKGKQLSWCIPCLNSHGEKNRQFLADVKQARGCIDCGTRDARLDFDHRPGTVKEFNLGHPRCSFRRLVAELGKCDVRCASCHTLRHWAEKRKVAA